MSPSPELSKLTTEPFLILTCAPSTVNARPVEFVIVSLELSNVRFNPPAVLLIPLSCPFIVTVEFLILILPSKKPRTVFSKFKVESIILIFPDILLLVLITPPAELPSLLTFKIE